MTGGTHFPNGGLGESAGVDCARPSADIRTTLGRCFGKTHHLRGRLHRAARPPHWRPPHSGTVTVLPTLSFFPRDERRFGAEVVAGLDAFRWHDSYENFRFVSFKLMNRLDASGTFRLVDREVFLSLAIASAFEALREADPDLLVFEVTENEPPLSVPWPLAQFSGVLTLFSSYHQLLSACSQN